MALASLAQLRPGPLERTRAEMIHIERRAAFRRERVSRARLRLRHSDALLELIEECRLRGYRLVPATLWSELVRFIGEVDPQLRDLLGIDRRPDHVSDVLFFAQELLQQLVHLERERPWPPAPIIPLFPHAAGA